LTAWLPNFATSSLADAMPAWACSVARPVSPERALSTMSFALSAA
jgi:hypothetical protein